MSNVETVRPDAVFAGGRETKLPDWTSLDPCPACKSRPHEAPEGIDANGNPGWTALHCWKCGFRPGVNTAVAEAEMRRQFELFKQMYNEQDALKHPSLNAPAEEQRPDNEEPAKTDTPPNPLTGS